MYSIYNVNGCIKSGTGSVQRMKILISNSSPDPIYEQIAKQIRNRIISGGLVEGEALPSIRKLAMDLQISVITSKRAYENLEKEGFIDTVAGRGSFVAVQNKQLLREKKMKIIEEKLGEAVSASMALGITKRELQEMLSLLFEEE
jgi:GntR family transcriptional regulator